MQRRFKTRKGSCPVVLFLVQPNHVKQEMQAAENGGLTIIKAMVLLFLGLNALVLATDKA